jgi:hypothetical protein
MPLQLFFADLHSEVPLQEFTPVHLTVAASAAKAVVVIPEVNSMAAAAATAALDSLLICIFDFLKSMERSGIAAHVKDPANGRIITLLSKLMPVSIGRQPVLGRAYQQVKNDGFLMFVGCIRQNYSRLKGGLERGGM